MKFMYVFNKEVAQSFDEKGLKKISEVVIDGKNAFVFENRKDIFIGKYEKNEILLSNKLFF